MKCVIFTVILAISSSSSYHHDHDHFGPPHGNEDLIHPPWWHPQKPSGPGRDLDPGTGQNGDGFDPFIPGGGDDPSGPGHSRWLPWGKHTTTTNKPSRITYPIFQPTTTSTTTTETIPVPGTSTNKPNSLDLVVQGCIASCPVTTEHNPVCGTNDVTYTNIGRLDCARDCGVDVQIKRRSPCSKLPPTPSPDNGDNNGGNNNGGNNNGGNNSGGERFQACIRNCSTTLEYNPVCGSDNLTYPNIGRLECARYCGLDVKLTRKTACSVLPTPDFTSVIQACITTCSVTPEYNPVCGTDNVTYPNPGRLECARNCGLDVHIRRKFSCSVPPGPDNPDLSGSTTETPSGNGNSNGNGNGNGNVNGKGNGNGNGNGHANGNGKGNGTGTPSMTEIIACMQLCPMTPEINPVCGTDSVTYSNPGKLLCTQFCGLDVRVRKFGPCLGKPIPNPQPCVCPTLPPPTEVPTNPTTTQDCINKCPVSQEMKPVCGTDGVTYNNLISLQCRMKCGVDVSVVKLSACQQVSTNQPTAETPPVWSNTDRPTQPTVATPSPSPGNHIQTCMKHCLTTEVYKPVCGTNGETYANLQKLQCAKRCGINVDLKSESACSTSPVIDGNKDENTTADNNGLDFTIPPDFLASIFNTPAPATQPTKPDDADDSYDVDQRFQDKTTIKYDAVNQTT